MRTKIARRLDRLSRQLTRIHTREGASARYNRVLVKWHRVQGVAKKEAANS